MPQVARIGDIAGGAIVNGANTVLAGGVPVATLGSVVSNGAVIIDGSMDVLAEGKPLASLGSVTSKGNAVANGLLTVITS
jgi:uncharacterized Zn-binding protein involved in type VI secretion